MHVVGGEPGDRYAGDWWERVHALLDGAFPGLHRGVRVAEQAGARWDAVSTPFVVFEGGEPVAHVGVMIDPMVLGGARVDVAGVHGVCTRPDRRGRGHARTLLAAALAWADDRHALAKLHTDVPEVYVGHGFRPHPTHRFRAAAKRAPAVRARPLRPLAEPADAALLADLLARRTPPSARLATADPGWMVTIDAALSRKLADAFVYLPDHDAVVAFADAGGASLVIEVIAEHLPPASAILAVAPADRPVVWSFSPDLLDPAATPEPAPAAIGTFMVRGPWPDLGPFGVSPLWEH